ncbi:MAG TPA: hypothetical protein DCQ77_07515 [Betaproteobacteria bacterium]|nr:hypothetical protein [Betaproteobacteria bacterium]
MGKRPWEEEKAQLECLIEFVAHSHYVSALFAQSNASIPLLASKQGMGFFQATGIFKAILCIAII